MELSPENIRNCQSVLCGNLCIKRFPKGETNMYGFSLCKVGETDLPDWFDTIKEAIDYAKLH